MDSLKLRSRKLRPHKLRLVSKLDKNLRKNLRSSLRSILHRQPQAIKRLKFLKLLYLNLCLKLRKKLRKKFRKKLRQFHQLLRQFH